jgi:hypothetical protein
MKSPQFIGCRAPVLNDVPDAWRLLGRDGETPGRVSRRNAAALLGI